MLAAMARLGTTLCAMLLCASCEGLGEFTTGPGEVYRGPIAGAPEVDDCPAGVTDCSFIRRSFPVDTVLDLTFEPELAAVDPGTITTSGEACGPTFDDTPLLPIVPLAHDQLSLYDFPGSGRARNYIFVARPTGGPLAGRDAMVFLSLVRGGNIEVRIIAGPGNEICDPTDCATLSTGACDFFGLFQVTREAL